MAGAKSKTLKKLPALKTDVEAERFVDSANLSEYDLSGGVQVRFELRRKDSTVNLRMPKGLLEVVKAQAARQNVPYQRYMRELIELGVRSKLSTGR